MFHAYAFAKMTLREKIGQLFMVGFAGASLTKDLEKFLTNLRPGGVILFSSNLEAPTQIASLANELQDLSPQIPLLIAIDQEGGRVSRLPVGFTVFPSCSVFGQCHSFELAYAAASATAAELRAVGINMNLAPVLDLHTNPSNPVIGDRAFSADPELVSTLGLATIAGLQDHRVIACGKHFPGHGDTNSDSHRELPVVTATKDRLLAMELRPFRYAMEHGLATIMTAHVLYPALDEHRPATLSPTILTALLREELGFKGPILTDDLEMRAILDHMDIREAALHALESGSDILLICRDTEHQAAAMEAVLEGVRQGKITEERVQRSLTRVLELKTTFLRAQDRADPELASQIVGNRAHTVLLDRVQQNTASHHQAQKAKA